MEATRAVLSGNLWLVLLDSFLVAAAYLLAYLLRFGFVIPQESIGVFETTVWGSWPSSSSCSRWLGSIG
jgi:hypothetical protein